LEICELKQMSLKMRVQAINMAYEAGKNGAHLGGGLSAIEIFAVLYGKILNINPQNWGNKDRDVVLLGKGHGVLAYYTALYETGFLTIEDIQSFEQPGSKFVGHPIRNIEKGIEFSSGSLGMALSVGAGLALSAKRRKSTRKIYVVMGDGECQEGSVWEALFFAVKYKLNNLVIVIDNNRIQSDGYTEDIGGYSDLAVKMDAFGCETMIVDGHDVEALLQAFEKEQVEVPRVIIANTVKGKGVSFMENDYKWHHSVLTKEQYEKALSEVRGKVDIDS